MVIAGKQPKVVDEAETVEETDIDVEHDVVVRLLPQEFRWVDVEAVYLGPAKPRVVVDLVADDE